VVLNEEIHHGINLQFYVSPKIIHDAELTAPGIGIAELIEAVVVDGHLNLLYGVVSGVFIIEGAPA